MKWEFDKTVLEIDAGDPDYMEKYEDALEILGETEENLKELADRCSQGLEKQSTFIRGYVRMFCDFFDVIHGDGTSEALFKGKPTVEKCNKAYASYVAALKQQTVQINKQREILFEGKI